MKSAVVFRVRIYELPIQRPGFVQLASLMKVERVLKGLMRVHSEICDFCLPTAQLLLISRAATGNIESRSGRERTFLTGKPANQSGAFRRSPQATHGNF